MKVRALDKSLVPGYHTLTVLALTPQRRGVLYHRLFSSNASDFVSEPAQVQTALQTVSRVIAPLKARRTLGRAPRDPECLVEVPDGRDAWQPGSIDAARACMMLVAQAQTEMEVHKRGQPRAKRQTVQLQIRACPIGLTYATNVRRPGKGETVSRSVWLLEIQLLDTKLEPWLLLTDWEVGTAAQAASGDVIFAVCAAVKAACMGAFRWTSNPLPL